MAPARREQRRRSVDDFMKSDEWGDYWSTGISRAEKGHIWVRGYPLEEIIEKLSYVESMWLLLRGELPTKRQAAIWELTMKIALDQQFISSAAVAARFVASAHPESPIPGVAAGILAHGSVTGSPRPARYHRARSKKWIGSSRIQLPTRWISYRQPSEPRR